MVNSCHIEEYDKEREIMLPELIYLMSVLNILYVNINIPNVCMLMYLHSKLLL